MVEAGCPLRTKPMKYDCETRILNLADMEVRLLEIKNSDELFASLLSLEPDNDNVIDERIPYWAELWPSAIALSRHILKSGRIGKGIEVLEIGCGLGLPGIVAGKKGAMVTFTDYMDDALDFAKENWKQNNTSDAKFQLLDWRNPDRSLAADVLLASDVAYEQRAFEPLLKTFDAMLKPGGLILLSEPGRKYMPAFFQKLEAAGFRSRKFCYTEFLRGVSSEIGVYEITRQ
jgi:ETFB lysine methyltransferase